MILCKKKRKEMKASIHKKNLKRKNNVQEWFVQVARLVSVVTKALQIDIGKELKCPAF